jgi:transposase
MMHLEFSEADKEQLSYERYHHPHPRVQQRMEVVWLKSQEISHHEIARLAHVTRGTVRNYVLMYKSGGIEALKALHFRKPESDLDAHRQTLEAYFRDHPPASITEAMAIIERLTGLKRRRESVRKYMHRIGLKCRRAGVIPAKADPVKQEEFKKNTSNRGWKKPKRASA